MRKIMKAYIFIALVLLVTTACSSGDNGDNGDNEDSSGDKEVIELRLNSDTTAEDDHTRAFVTPWIEQVEEKTEGQVKIDAFFGEELLPLGEEVRALESNRIDIAAALYPSYDSGEFPLSDVTMLPLKHSDALIAAKAYSDLISSEVEIEEGKTFVEVEYGQYNLKVLPMQPITKYIIGLADQKIETEDDLKNLQLRTGGRAHELFVEEIGSQPVAMPYSEEFEALSRGVIDGNIRSFLDYKPFGFDEIITNSLTVNLGHFPMLWAMDEERWNDLPEDVKTVMEETAYELTNESTVKSEAEEQGILDAKEGGIEITEVSELDSSTQDYIEQASVRTWEAWIAANEEKGLPGLEAAELWRDLIIENGGEVYDGVMDLE